MGLRYHVVSLVAVLVALGIGILLGASMAGDEGLAGQQRALIDQLHSDFARLARERDDLAWELGASLKYAEETMPYIVQGRLAGKTIAIVAMPLVEAGDVALAERACRVAGGTVGAIITIGDNRLIGARSDEIAVWAQAVASSDLGRVRSLAATGVAKVKMSQDCRFDALLVLALPEIPAGRRTEFIDALGCEAQRSNMPRVIGWAGEMTGGRAGAYAGAEAGAGTGTGTGTQSGTGTETGTGARSGRGMASTYGASGCTQVYGISQVPGTVAAVMALAGAEGAFGMPPAPAFLPLLPDGKE
ncbi:MAG: copper transporter [Clostridia bacterium]|nr:copper transporter [Clostridia bacterium]